MYLHANYRLLLLTYTKSKMYSILLKFFRCFDKFVDDDNESASMMGSSTPPQSPHHLHAQGEKHGLTPESKAAVESKPKRFAGLLSLCCDYMAIAGHG